MNNIIKALSIGLVCSMCIAQFGYMFIHWKFQLIPMGEIEPFNRLMLLMFVCLVTPVIALPLWEKLR